MKTSHWWTSGIACLALTASLITPSIAAPPKSPKTPYAVLVRTRDGKTYEGVVSLKSLPFQIEGKRSDIPLTNLLSLQRGAPAGAEEAATITTDLTALTAGNRATSEQAQAELVDIGLPALTPLLQAYKDTDLHEPNPLYHLYARLVDGYADSMDRSLDLIRLADGEHLRANLMPDQLPNATLTMTDMSGTTQNIPAAEIRSLAVRRPEIIRTFEVKSLVNCTQIAFLDTGVTLTSRSTFHETAQGLVRLSFDIDGWASDPDGLKKPGPHYTTNLVDGFPFGALVGRIGPTGSRWFAGRHFEKTNPGKGRLYFAVNDNGHWQNNIGSFQVTLHVAEAYDMGEPR